MRMARLRVCVKGGSGVGCEKISAPVNFDISTEQTGYGNQVQLRGKEYILDMPLSEALEELNAEMNYDRYKIREIDSQLESHLAEMKAHTANSPFLEKFKKPR